MSLKGGFFMKTSKVLKIFLVTLIILIIVSAIIWILTDEFKKFIPFHLNNDTNTINNMCGMSDLNYIIFGEYQKKYIKINKKLLQK